MEAVVALTAKEDQESLEWLDFSKPLCLGPFLVKIFQRTFYIHPCPFSRHFLFSSFVSFSSGFQLVSDEASLFQPKLSFDADTDSDTEEDTRDKS